jgi:hypothetical protein
MMYLKHHDLPELDEIAKGYNRAFGSSFTDGVREMVLHFSDDLTEGRLKPETIQRVYVEFCAMLKVFFDDFRNSKLVPNKYQMICPILAWHITSNESFIRV